MGVVEYLAATEEYDSAACRGDAADRNLVAQGLLTAKEIDIAGVGFIRASF